MKEIAQTRARLEAAIRKAVDGMPKYHGNLIDARDFVDDALIYALDAAVSDDAVLQAEAALLEERASLSEQLHKLRTVPDPPVVPRESAE